MAMHFEQSSSPALLPACAAPRAAAVAVLCAILQLQVCSFTVMLTGLALTGLSFICFSRDPC